MVLVIDSQIAGISGDMLLCSLVDLGADKSKIIKGIRAADEFHDGSINRLEFEKTTKHGIEATSLVLELHDDHNTKTGTNIRDCISKTCAKIGLSQKASSFADSSIQTLVDAESKIHGVSADSVHLHEASGLDTIVDILGTSIALDDLNLFDEEIVCTPVAVGSGHVSFSHGTTSNPAGAILEIFKNSCITITGNNAKNELTTPTGACMLVSLIKSCREFYPTMTVSSIGYGAGQRDFEDFSNVLKLVCGTKSENLVSDAVKILETNIDDVSGEILGHMIDRLVENGAKDVTVSPAVTKKGRPTNLVTIICDPRLADLLLRILISETGTLGVRMRTSERITVRRSTKTILLKIKDCEFSISYKVNEESGKYKIESDDIRAVAKSLYIPFREAEELIRAQINKE